LRSCCCIS